MFLLGVSAGFGWDGARWPQVLDSGLDGLLIRERQLEARPRLVRGRRGQDHAPQQEPGGAGRLDVALAAGCGLHAPEAYPEVEPGLLPLSRPLHAESQWQSRRGCTQLLVAPVRAVPGKGEPWGVARLHAFLDSLPAESPRLLALGGVAPDTIRALRHPRLAGAALIRALWERPDPRRTVAALRAEWAR